MATGF